MSAVSYQGPKPHQAGGPTSSNGRLHASIGTARTGVDDLQAEMEAAVRRADRIDAEVSAIEGQMMQHFELAAQLGTIAAFEGTAGVDDPTTITPA